MRFLIENFGCQMNDQTLIPSSRRKPGSMNVSELCAF